MSGGVLKFWVNPNALAQIEAMLAGKRIPKPESDPRFAWAQNVPVTEDVLEDAGPPLDLSRWIKPN